MKNIARNRNTQIKVLIPILLLIPLIISSPVIAWDNCPFGEVNETYPGTCGRYTDTDQDNICDLSQPLPNLRVEASDNSNTIDQEQNQSSDVNSSNTAPGINYYFIPILLVLIVLYALTFSLGKKKIMQKNDHRKIWNVILLITFLVSAVFGLILAISLSLGIRLSFYKDLLFWHVEFGIAMAIISFFHIAWHWKYYKNIIKK